MTDLPSETISRGNHHVTCTKASLYPVAGTTLGCGWKGHRMPVRLFLCLLGLVGMGKQWQAGRYLETDTSTTVNRAPAK